MYYFCIVNKFQLFENSRQLKHLQLFLSPRTHPLAWVEKHPSRAAISACMIFCTSQITFCSAHAKVCTQAPCIGRTRTHWLPVCLGSKLRPGFQREGSQWKEQRARDAQTLADPEREKKTSDSPGGMKWDDSGMQPDLRRCYGSLRSKQAGWNKSRRPGAATEILRKCVDLLQPIEWKI